MRGNNLLMCVVDAPYDDPRFKSLMIPNEFRQQLGRHVGCLANPPGFAGGAESAINNINSNPSIWGTA